MLVHWLTCSQYEDEVRKIIAANHFVFTHIQFELVILFSKHNKKNDTKYRRVICLVTIPLKYIVNCINGNIEQPTPNSVLLPIYLQNCLWAIQLVTLIYSNVLIEHAINNSETSVISYKWFTK